MLKPPKAVVFAAMVSAGCPGVEQVPVVGVEAVQPENTHPGEIAKPTPEPAVTPPSQPPKKVGTVAKPPQKVGKIAKPRD